MFLTLCQSQMEDHEGESHNGRLPLPRCDPAAFFSVGVFLKKGGGLFFALVSRLGERQDKDGKGKRIRAEALVV